MVLKLKQKYTSTKLIITCDTHRHSNATETVSVGVEYRIQN